VSNYEVVARRWRPLTFASVVGQSHVTGTLANAVRRDRIPHAFLLTGTRGVGKTTIARLLARAINCTNRGDSAEPCNECPSCKGALAGSSLDIIEIDGASNNSVDEVRDLIEAAQYRPSKGRFKVYIVDEVHQLTKSAFKALLKTARLAAGASWPDSPTNPAGTSPPPPPESSPATPSDPPTSPRKPPPPQPCTPRRSPSRCPR
jgi:DNA polymerase III subunit gamma/tau